MNHDFDKVEFHHTPAADLPYQRVFILVEPTVSVGDLPSQRNEFCVLFFVNVPVKNLHDFIHGNARISLFISRVDEFGSPCRRELEMLFNKQPYAIEFALPEHMIRSRNVDHQDGCHEAQRGFPRDEGQKTQFMSDASKPIRTTVHKPSRALWEDSG